MSDKDYLIELMEARIKGLEIENALLKNGSNRKAVKNKWGKAPCRERHLKLISINGPPVPTKE